MQVFVITGASDGIGAEIARQLAAQHKSGAALVLAARNDIALQAVAGQCRAHGAQAAVVRTDVGDAAQCRALIDAAMAQYGRIDVLINNAGAATNALERTSDGLERCFAVNVAATLALTRALLPALEAAQPARVVMLTGGTARGAVDAAALNGEAFDGLNTYSNSKKALEAASLALGVELAPRGVFVNVVYPGQASTSMTQSMTASAFPWFARPFFPLFKWLVRDDGGKGARKASRSSVFAATSPTLDRVHGKYFSPDCQEQRLHASVYDGENQRRVLALVPPAA